MRSVSGVRPEDLLSAVRKSPDRNPAAAALPFETSSKKSGHSHIVPIFPVLFCASIVSKELEQQYLDELMAYKIEGLIVLSHTFSSKELSAYHIPIVAIEREDKHICSVNTDNYMGAVQATSLLIRNKCEILIHINVPVPEEIPAYNRIRGFEDTCREHHVPYDLILRDLGYNYETTFQAIRQVFQTIEQTYPDKKKGVFLANDTYANIFLNLIIQKYGKLPVLQWSF